MTYWAVTWTDEFKCKRIITASTRHDADALYVEIANTLFINDARLVEMV